MKPDYLTPEDVIAIHDTLIKRYGGLIEIRDMGAVQAAVYRPQCGYYQDIIQEACALFESLLINHPFLDGNKRTAFAACDVFLRINGYRITASSHSIQELVLKWIALDAGQRFHKWKKIYAPLFNTNEYPKISFTCPGGSPSGLFFGVANEDAGYFAFSPAAGGNPRRSLRRESGNRRTPSIH